MTALRDACKLALGANLLLLAGCLRLISMDVQVYAATNLAILSASAGLLCAVGAWGKREETP